MAQKPRGGWAAGPPPSPPAEGDVLVVFAELGLPAADILDMAECLSPDERARAQRFHFERDRNRFVAGRGILRSLLGQFLGVDAGEVAFQYGPHGKPRLADQAATGDLRFNLSHSQDGALFAVTRGRDVGVDLEFIRPLRDMDAVAHRCFSDRVNAELHDLPPEQELRRFFTWWARREAFQKATGEGLAAPLTGFDVAPNAGGPSHQVLHPSRPADRERWRIADLDLHPDFAAALAMDAHTWNLACWLWPPPAGG